MSPKSNWNYPTAVKFGAGRVKELPQHLAATGIRNPLIVTDAGIAAMPMMAGIKDVLADAKISFGIFSDVKPNHPNPTFMRARGTARRQT